MNRPDPSRIPRVFRYGDAPSQFGELYLPDAERPPVVCLLHGGFWRLAYACDPLVPLARDLAARGFAVWNVEYRRLGEPGGGWPGTLLDVAAAIDHLETVACQVPLDLARVITVGHSAGGQLALWAGARARVPGQCVPASRVRVVAAAGQAAVSDLAEGHALRLSRDVVRELLGGSPAEFPGRYAAASPRELLPHGVPQLLLHGTDDDTVPIAMSRAHAAAAVASGDACELEEFPGMGHMEHIDPAGEAHVRLCRWLEGIVRPTRRDR